MGVELTIWQMDCKHEEWTVYTFTDPFKTKHICRQCGIVHVGLYSTRPGWIENAKLKLERTGKRI